ncbi:ABC transporter permease [Terrimonas alba]|uniref:ABC transporter permease n=1 Tax=Terrimonas alba TaxID=3349636 RepID=UPI0035F22F13
MLIRIVTDWLRRSNKLERLWLMAKIEFKLRYYENKLGLLWALIKPVSDIVIYYVAFEMIMNQGIPNFISFLFIGLIIWNFFVESTTGTIQILNTKKYLYEYTNMNKIEIYLSHILSNCIGFFFNFFMFTLYFHFFEKGIPGYGLNAIYFIPIFLNLIIISLAISLILSNIYVVANDVTQIWAVVISIGFWLSPILFKLEVFRNALPGVDYINPLAGIIINARNVLLYHTEPDWGLFFFGWVYGIILLMLGLLLLNKLGSKAAEKL